MTEMVDHPSHYQVFPDADGEAIEIIKKVLTPDEFIGWLKGDVLKYRLRAGFKDATEQDINKAKWYQEYLFKHLQKVTK